jgi:hypothetical protein
MILPGPSLPHKQHAFGVDDGRPHLVSNPSPRICKFAFPASLGVFYYCYFSLPSFSQTVINRSVLSGNGSDQPNVIATDNNGYVYIAGSTTSGNFPITNALEPIPPQGALEVSVNGGSFANSGLPATGASAV